MAWSYNKYKLKDFMTFISRLINDRINNLISRFDVQKVPPHMVEKILIENIGAKRVSHTTHSS